MNKFVTRPVDEEAAFLKAVEVAHEKYGKYLPPNIQASLEFMADLQGISYDEKGLDDRED